MKYPDFDKAFAPTPDIVRLSMEAAFRKGEKAMKIKHKITAVLSAAAVLLVVCAAAVFALPNESQPDVVSQPVLAEPAEDPTVYYTSKGTYYHNIEDCSGMKNAQPHPLTETQADGKLACPVCIQSTAATDATAAPYGASTVLSESGQVALLESRPLPTEQAYDANPTPSPSPLPMPADENAAIQAEPVEEQIAYYTENGTYYHFYMHCSGMRNAKGHTLSEAEAAGKLRCPTCVREETPLSTVYALNDPMHPDPIKEFYDVDAVPDVIITPAKRASDIFTQVFGAYLFDVFADYEYVSANAWGNADESGVLYEQTDFIFARDGQEFTPVSVYTESKDDALQSGSINILPPEGFDYESFYENTSPWFQKAAETAWNTVSSINGNWEVDARIEQLWGGFDSHLKPCVCNIDFIADNGFYSLSLDIEGDQVSHATVNYSVSMA